MKKETKEKEEEERTGTKEDVTEKFNIYRSVHKENQVPLNLLRLMKFTVSMMPRKLQINFILPDKEINNITWKYNDSSIMIVDLFNITQRKITLNQQQEGKRAAKKMKTPEETAEELKKDTAGKEDQKPSSN